ncbi:hypothetical protein MIND_01300900 [Mycena indigotica]|uniref:Uncharacterized protein n=1 Tax=Mycena indigotica TaxID=2126181 RepID=A0A8H6S2F0_9AGAR|nr:uncharacterized protein MIND_01300900 [Mycena indigotica]KAF7290607.1 hypothetical protein MIND_01300900 [Mycena indigotica]
MKMLLLLHLAPIIMAASTRTLAVPTPKDVEASNMVLTPAGLRHVSTVHEVPLGGSIRHISNSTIHILDATHTIVKVVNIDPTVTPTSDAVVPAASGWIAYAYFFNAGAAIGSFKTTWTVPPPPSVVNSQSIFLFNAIQPVSDGVIMQPVLQWGQSAAGGGNSWNIASWFVSPGGTFFTTLIGVSPGQSIQGQVQLVGANSDNTRFSYLSSFTNQPATELRIDDVDQLRLATVALEAYGITQSGNYPSGSTTFSGINLELSTGQFPDIVWGTLNDNTDGISVNVGTQGSTSASITISY